MGVFDEFIPDLNASKTNAGPTGLEVAPKPGRFDAFIPGPPDAADALSAARSAVKPDDAARAKKLALPPDVYTQDKESYEARALDEASAAALNGFPVTSQWIAKDPMNAAIASDVVPELTAFDKTVQELVTGATELSKRLHEGSGLMGAIVKDGSNTRSFYSGGYSATGGAVHGMGELWNMVGRGMAAPVDAALDALGLTDVKNYLHTPIPAWASPGTVLAEAGKTIKAVGELTDVPADQKTFANDVSGALGQVTAQATTLLLGAGMAGGTVTSFKDLALSAQSMLLLWSQGASQAADAYDKATKSPGAVTQLLGAKATDPAVRDAAVSLGGAATAVTERFGLNLLFDKIPKATSSQILRILAGASTEAVQEFSENVLNNLVSIALYDPNKAAVDSGDLYAGGVGAAAGAITSMVLPGAKVAIKRRDVMDKLVQDLQASKLAQRDPDAAADHIGTVMAEHGLPDVFIPANALTQILGDVPEQILPALGLTPEQYQGALERGGDVRVSGKDFAKEVALDPARYEMVRGQLRFAEDAMNADEAEQADTLAHSEGQGAVNEAALAPLQPELTARLAEDGAQAVDPQVAADITATEEQLGLKGLFTTAAEAGMTAPEYTEYLYAKAQAAQEAARRQQLALTRQVERESSNEWKAQREVYREEITAKVRAEPVYAAVDGLKGEKFSLDSVQAADVANDTVMSTFLPKQVGQSQSKSGQLRDVYRPIVAAKGKGGIDVTAYAEQYGFESGAAMLRAMLNAPPVKVAVEERLDTFMRSKHPDMFDRNQALAQARESLLNDTSAALLAQELDALNGSTAGLDAKAKAKRAKAQAAIFKEAARQRLSAMKIKDISVNAFLNTMKLKGQQAGVALRNGGRDKATQQLRGSDRAGAARLKYEQLLNMQYAREATAIQKEVTAAAKHLSGLANPNKTHPGIDADYVDRIRNLLKPYNFRKAPGVAPEKVYWRDMTLDQFREIQERAEFLEKQGRDVQKFHDGNRERDYAKLKQELLGSSDTSADADFPAARDPFGLKKVEDAPTLDKGVWKNLTRKMTALHAIVAKVELLLERLDAGSPVGPWKKAIYQPFVTAQGIELDMTQKLMKPVLAAIEQLNANKLLNFTKAEYDPGLGRYMTRGERIMIALNSGNESNLRKMIEGSTKGDSTVAWTQEAVDASNASLTPDEAKIVQKVWDAFETIRPQVEEIYRRQVGSNFKAIEAREVIVGGEKLKGGYYPMMYDHGQVPAQDHKTILERMQDPVYRASVFSGMTKVRAENFSAPVLLDFAALGNAIRDSVHFVSHFEAVSNVSKILNDADINRAIRKNLGAPYHEELKRWLDAVASNNSYHSGDADVNSVFQKVRSNITIAYLGGSMTTLLSQTFGAASSVAVLGKKPNGTFSSREGMKWVREGYAQVLSNPKEAVELAMEISGEMRHRIGSADRETAATLARLVGKEGKYAAAQRASLMMIGGMQFHTVDLPTFYAGLNKAIAAGYSAEDAVIYAESVVRTSQASGHVKDLSNVQRAKGWQQWATMFSTYTMLQFNQGLEIAHDSKASLNSAASAVARYGWIFALPAILGALMRQQRPPDDDDPVEALGWWGAKITAESLKSIPLIGGSLPAIDLGQRFYKGALGLGKAVVGGDAPKEADLEAVGLALGTSVGMPGTMQSMRILGTVRTMMEGEDWNPMDFVSGHRSEKTRTRNALSPQR